MRNILIILNMLVCAQVGAQGAAVDVKVEEKESVKQCQGIEVAVSGETDLMADKQKKVFVEFADSPRLTAGARRWLASANFDVVEARGDADVVYVLEGAYQALRPATRRTAEVSVGGFVENPASLATKSGRGGSVMLSMNPITLLLGTIGLNVGNVLGAQDAVNAATVGDPDGKCLAKCDGWKYIQRNVVNLTRIDAKSGERETRLSILASVEADAMMPGHLIRAAFISLHKATGMDIKIENYGDLFLSGDEKQIASNCVDWAYNHE